MKPCRQMLRQILSPSVASAVAVLCTAVFVAGAPSSARAAGVVGTGTAASCTDAALNMALAGGGSVTFDCGPAPVTIDISTGTGTKTIAADTIIDGGGLTTISGGNRVRVISVNPGVHFIVDKLTIANGSGAVTDNDNGGGGIKNRGTLNVTNSVFTGNVARFGGAILNFNSGTLTVANSTFAGNAASADGVEEAANGGGIDNFGMLTVANSTFAHNGANLGGGISNFGTLTVTNSTFTGNGASDNVAAGGGEGGGIFSNGALTVANSTFTGNIADVFGGGIVEINATAVFRNTIIAANNGANCAGSITDGGHNLDDGTSCGFSAANGSLSNTDPQLDPAGLQNNGGPTQTMALCTRAGVPVGCTAASPAIGAGDQAVCAAPPVNDRDQSGFVRPGAGQTRCSIGAFEADASAPACSGDCQGGGRVSIDELIMGVGIALGTTALDQCQAFDCNGTGRVTVDCLVQAVHNALDGCPATAVGFAAGSCDFKLPDGHDPANVRCGYLTVPEDRSQAHGRTIRLAVAVLKATGAHPVSDPIAMLSGGPGDPYLGYGMRSWTADFAAPLLAKRDLVFFDQRGTGLSEPGLQCPEYTASFSAELTQALTAEQDAATLQTALHACHDRLVSEGVNLAAYTDAATAADLHDLMTTLGYSQWNLRGISNGTRVALTALRDSPQGIRSVVLDSTIPVQANWHADFSADYERALNTLFAGCAADFGCNAAYPGLDQTFFDLVARLNVSPVTVRPIDPATGAPFSVVITGDRLLLGIQQALYDTTLIPLLPAVITATAGGDTTLLTVAAAGIAAPSSLAQGVFRSVLCGEEVPFYTPEIIAAATSGVRAEITKVGLLGITDFDLDVCAYWGSNQPPPLENEAVTSSVPALVLAGEYDPISPPAYGTLAAQTLSHSFYFLFPGQGHGQLFNPLAPTCAIDLVAAFIDDPTQLPDGSCVAALPPPHFLGS